MVHRLKLGLAVATTAALAMVVTGSALADADVTVTGNINAGALAFTSSAAPSFSVNLDGSDQSPTYNIPSVAEDSRGSGDGWNVTITSTRFETGGTPNRTLSNSASWATAVSVSCLSGQTCTDPSNSISYPLAIPAGATPPTAVKLYNAAVDTGRGEFDPFSPTIQVGVPANTYAGTYTSIVSLAIVSGP
jgi:hypothetical protein